MIAPQSFPLQVVISANDRASAVLRQFGTNFALTNAKITSVGKSLSLAVSTPLAAIAGLSIRAAGTFDESFSRVRSLLGMTDLSLVDTKQKVIDLGNASKLGPTAAAQAFAGLVEKGQSLTDSLSALPGVLNLIKSTGQDAATTSMQVGDVMKQWGLKAADTTAIVDQISRSQRAGGISAVEFVEDLKQISPIARTIGYDFKELSRDYLAFAALGGVQGPRLFRRLIQDIDVDKMKDAKGQFLHISQLLDLMRDHPIDPSAAAKHFGQSWTVLKRLIDEGGSQRLDAFGNNMERLPSALKSAASAFDGTKGTIADFDSQWQQLELDIAKSGVLDFFGKLVKILGSLTRAFDQLPSPMKSAAFGLGVAGAVIGPAVATGGGLFAAYKGIQLLMARGATAAAAGEASALADVVAAGGGAAATGAGIGLGTLLAGGLLAGPPVAYGSWKVGSWLGDMISGPFERWAARRAEASFVPMQINRSGSPQQTPALNGRVDVHFHDAPAGTRIRQEGDVRVKTDLGERKPTGGR